MSKGSKSAVEETPQAGPAAIEQSAMPGVALDGQVRLLVMLDRCDEALALYRRRLAAGLADLEDHRAASELFFSLERYAEALDACEQAIALDPDDALLYENQGTLLALLGRYSEALTSYGRACEFSSESEPLMWLNHATALRELGRTEAALLLYDRGLALAPTAAQAIVLLTCKGDVLMELGRITEAVDTFDEALRLKQLVAPDADDRPGEDFFDYLSSVGRQAHALL